MVARYPVFGPDFAVIAFYQFPDDLYPDAFAVCLRFALLEPLAGIFYYLRLIQA